MMTFVPAAVAEGRRAVVATTELVFVVMGTLLVSVGLSCVAAVEVWRGR